MRFQKVKKEIFEKRGGKLLKKTKKKVEKSVKTTIGKKDNL